MSDSSSPLQTLYRLTVMTGVLVVGSMAAYRYGPPPERLADLIDGAASRIGELPQEFAPAADPTAPLAAAPEAAPAFAPPPAPMFAATPASAPAQPLVGVESIGATGQVYRATAAAPGPAGMTRRFDAVGETAAAARAAVVAKMAAAGIGG